DPEHGAFRQGRLRQVGALAGEVEGRHDRPVDLRAAPYRGGEGDDGAAVVDAVVAHGELRAVQRGLDEWPLRDVLAERVRGRAPANGIAVAVDDPEVDVDGVVRVVDERLEELGAL